MLATCTRCRHRRVKCDSRLPACANCAKADVECTFRDEALQEDIPRSYIQTLNERIQHLNAQLALYRPDASLSEIPRDQTKPPSSAATTHPTLRILVPARAGSDLRIDYSIPSLFAKVVFEALPAAEDSHRIEDMLNGHSSDQHLLLAANPTACSERTHLTPATLRFLLGRYDSCIRPRYPVPIPDLPNPDDSSFKKLAPPVKFKILMACAIAAARETYRDANWKPLAQICRDWANELITAVITAGDRDTLTAILLLLIYELVDPSRGITWELLDLAARTCLQLGWHQTTTVSADGQVIGSSTACSADDIQLLSVLREIEGSLRTIVSKPSMLSNTRLPTASDNENIYDLYVQIHDQLYGKGEIYANQGCPFVGEVASLMQVLGSLPADNPVACEAWLSFLPICFKHRQCIFCLQEADEEDEEDGFLVATKFSANNINSGSSSNNNNINNANNSNEKGSSSFMAREVGGSGIGAVGMRSLRRRVVLAATSLVQHVHEQAIVAASSATNHHQHQHNDLAQAQNHFVPPMIACCRAFVAGCSLAMAIAKKWTPLHAHARELVQCTEIMARFASDWKGGGDYMNTWSIIVDLVFSAQARHP